MYKNRNEPIKQMHNVNKSNYKIQDNINYLQIMSNYQEQSTNFMSNPFNQHKTYMKQKLIEEPINYTEQDNSKTIGFQNINTDINNDQTIKPGKMPKKIKVPISDKKQISHQSVKQKKTKGIYQILEKGQSETKTKVKAKTSERLKLFLTQPLQQKKSLSINQFKAVESKKELIQRKSEKNTQMISDILTKPSQRQKYGHLLPQMNRKNISSEQRHLLNLLTMMDNTIEYSFQARSNTKYVLFYLLRKNLLDSMRVMLDLQHLEKLLYLDQTLFEVTWLKRPSSKQNSEVYDLAIAPTKFKSKNLRKQDLRATIIQFLDMKHKQFLQQLGITNFKGQGWHQDFNPKNYDIPRKTLPPHPETKAAEIRCLDDAKIDAIKNPKVKQLFKEQKQKAQIKSFTTKDASKLILSGRGCDIQERLLASIRQKQKQHKRILEEQLKNIQIEKTVIRPAILKEIVQNVFKIYLGKNVSNISRVTLIGQVKDRINNKFGDLALNRHMEYLVQLKQIGFLKQVVLRDKTVIWQMNAKKYKSILDHVQDLKKEKPVQIVQQ